MANPNAFNQFPHPHFGPQDPIDKDMELDGAGWGAWPTNLLQPDLPPQDQAQEEISLAASAVSNPSHNKTVTISDCSQLPQAPNRSTMNAFTASQPAIIEPLLDEVNKEAQDTTDAVVVPAIAPRREITIVYCRRRFKKTVANTSNPASVRPSSPTNENSGKGKEVILQPQPNIDDFLQAAKAGTTHVPLFLGQIQHAGVHLCGLPAELLTEGNLSNEPNADLQLVVASVPVETVAHDKE
ncbi:hypothetical protein GUJ93_ZPchr0009g1689 [Zizania palustris]|uniref:Uncharacterized protein n=1 Tax=Zizania palustris TaxID=103762 RepID=A0A8J5RG73_ZIZPA|nr:hypothetical protein GUJ93_ZPchr0009g1689 [Zizania palustris]